MLDKERELPEAADGVSGIVLEPNRSILQALDNSRPIDVYKRSDHPSIRAAVDDIISTLTQSAHPRLAALNLASTKQRRRLREHVSVIVLDLFIAWAENSDPEDLKSVLGRPYVAYSRDKNAYRAGSRYAALHLKYRLMMAAVDGLVELGLIEHRLGFHDRRTGVGRQSRMRATLALMELLLAHRLTPRMVSRGHPLIVLRDDHGRDVDTTDMQEADGFFPGVERINMMLRDADIQLHLTREQRVDLLRRCHVDTTRNTVYRVFNGDFAHGGRFYGHWCQNIPGEFRPLLTLKGCSVVELDFSSMHPRMLYALAGVLPPVGDLYALDNRDPYYRPVIKKLLNALINARTELAAVNSVLHGSDGQEGIARAYGLDRNQVLQIVASIKEKHRAISGQFGSGAGLRLQNIDSEIAESVMLTLAELGIPSIPLHDSFLVPAPHAVALHTAMRTASEKHLSMALPVDIEHGDQHLSDYDHKLIAA